jgi:hypothetical protein
MIEEKGKETVLCFKATLFLFLVKSLCLDLKPYPDLANSLELGQNPDSVNLDPHY